jgi:hypothetical protein
MAKHCAVINAFCFFITQLNTGKIPFIIILQINFTFFYDNRSELDG